MSVTWSEADNLRAHAMGVRIDGPLHLPTADDQANWHNVARSFIQRESGADRLMTAAQSMRERNVRSELQREIDQLHWQLHVERIDAYQRAEWAAQPWRRMLVATLVVATAGWVLVGWLACR